MNVALAVPATVLGSSGRRANKAMVTKIPPGPMVVIQIPPTKAIISNRIMISVLMAVIAVKNKPVYKDIKRAGVI
jgi:hypothetical protein